MTTYTTTGTLVTETKSFSEPKEPGLVDLVYSLNGQSITVDVVGSPGTADEEVVTQSLGGAADYPLAWQNAHTDFRLEATLSTSDTSVAPEVDSFSTGNLDASTAVSGGAAVTTSTSTTVGSPTMNVSGGATTTTSAGASISTDGNVTSEAPAITATGGSANIGAVSTTGTATTETTATGGGKALNSTTTTISSGAGGDGLLVQEARTESATATTGGVQSARSTTAESATTASSGASVSATHTTAATAASSSSTTAAPAAVNSVGAPTATASTAGGEGTGYMSASSSLSTSTSATAEVFIATQTNVSASTRGGLDSRNGVTAAAAASSDASATLSGTSITNATTSVQSSARGLLEADEIGTIDTSRLEDGTVTVEWTTVERSRAFSGFRVDERVNGTTWEQIAELDAPDARSYTTYPLPDRPETFEYRVRGVAAGRVADTRADDSKYWAQESSIRTFPNLDSRKPESPPAKAADGALAATATPTTRIERNPSTGWDEEQALFPEVAGAEPLVGEGTALRLVADRLADIGGEGDPISAGDGTWEFGVPQRFDASLTPDPGVEWPVSINQTYALRIDDPDYLESIDAFANAQGECTVNTEITNVRVIDGSIAFTLQMVVDCPSGTGTADVGGGFVPNPSPDAPDDGSGPDGSGPYPAPSDPSGGSPGDPSPDFGGGGGSTYRHPISRGVSPGGGCVPQGTSSRFPIRVVMEHAAIDAYDLRFSFDPDVIEVTGAGAGQMAPTIEAVDNENGYLRLTSDAGGAVGFSPHNPDVSNVASYVEYDVLSDDGTSTTVELLPQSKALRNGYEVPRTSYGAGTITVGAGYTLPSMTIPWGETAEYTVGTETGAPIQLADVALTYPAGPVTVNAVKSADMNVTGYNFPEAGVLEVNASASTPARDLDLFTIEFEAYQPDTIGDIRVEDDPEVQIDGALSTLTDNRGDLIATPCSQTGSVGTTGNMDPDDPDGSGDRLKLPEVGVVYWPILLPITLEATGINTDLVTEDMVRVSFQSETNDVNWEVKDVEVAPPDDETAVRVFAGVEIPKADPQTYPVDLAGQIWFAQANAGFSGAGLHVGVPVSLGGAGQGISANISIPQLGLGSAGLGL